jgi:antitoxin CptB
MTIHRGRVRWHCRRALLELDLVFARFLDESFDQLSEAQLVNLQELLDLEDHDLWAMVNGSKECTETRWMPIIDMLRHPGASRSSHGNTQ